MIQLIQYKRLAGAAWVGAVCILLLHFIIQRWKRWRLPTRGIVCLRLYYIIPSYKGEKKRGYRVEGLSAYVFYNSIIQRWKKRGYGVEGPSAYVLSTFSNSIIQRQKQNVGTICLHILIILSSYKGENVCHTTAKTWAILSWTKEIIYKGEISFWPN